MASNNLETEKEEDSMAPFFTCPICIEYMNSKIIICSNGHSMCFKCAHSVRLKCPFCKISFNIRQRNLALEDAAKQYQKLFGDKVNVEKSALFNETIAEERVVPGQTQGIGPQWIVCQTSDIPDNAFSAGNDITSTLYVARVAFRGGFIIGKIHSHYKAAYIPWGGREFEFNLSDGEVEILCNFTGYWVPCSGGAIPENAFPGGTSENGETLYIGRVHHEGPLGDTFTNGKVHPSHGVLYICFGGIEYAYRDYEILCH